MTDSRNKYYAPTLRSVVLGVGVLLCISGDVKSLNYIGIGDGYTVYDDGESIGNDF